MTPTAGGSGTSSAPELGVRAGTGHRPGADRAVWTRVGDVGGVHLDLMTARIGRRHYAPHAHDEYAIGVCTDGVEVIRYRGERYHADRGRVVVLEPGEPHTGGPADEHGFSYRVLYPVPGLLAEALPGFGGVPHFRDAVIDDPSLACRIRAAHLALTRPDGDALEGESMMLSALGALVERYAERPVASRRATFRGGRGVDAGGPAGVWIARTVSSRLADELTAPPTLAELAADLGVSRYRLLRAFREAVGMPPYAWLAQYRVTRARGLLDAGYRPAEVAVMAGFADQAHLTRWFRRVLGVTPGAYRAGVLPRR